MQIVIDIDEDYFEIIKHDVAQGNDYKPFKLIANGTPLDEHDEEVIKETVESIWGKPPYTEVLDKIRDEIEQITDTMGVSYNQYVSKIDVLQIIDKYRKEKLCR